MNTRRRIGVLVALIVALATIAYYRTSLRQRATFTTAREVDAHASVEPVDLHAGGTSFVSASDEISSDTRIVAGHVVLDGRQPDESRVRLFRVGPGGMRYLVRETHVGGRGYFTLGAHRATEYAIVAEAPGLTAASQTLDLRDPLLRSDELELVLRPCTASLAGRTLDRSAGSIPHASILIADGTSVMSGDDGRFEVCVSPGLVDITVAADSYAAVRLTRRVIRGRLNVDVLMVPEAAPLQGMVVTRDGSIPVEGALVSIDGTSELWAGVWQGPRATTTDLDGAFLIDGLAPGRHRMAVSANGFAAGEIDVLVTQSETTITPTIYLAQSRKITGRVLQDGLPVPGLRVVAVSLTSEIGFDAVSQSDGTFEITNLPGDVYTIHTRGILKENAATVDVRSVDALGLDISVELGSIQGRVTRSGVALAGVEVRARGPSIDWTTSMRDGTFTLRNLARGQYVVSAEDLHLGVFARTGPVEVASHESTVVDLEMNLAATVSGRVLDDRGDGVAGAYVRLERKEGLDYGLATTNSDGSFVATAMAGEGDYAISVASPDPSDRAMMPLAAGSVAVVPVPDRESHVTDITVRVQTPRGYISGFVVDEDGRPLMDAMVSAISTANGVASGDATDIEGRFSIGRLHRDRYLLLVTAPDGSSVSVDGVEPGSHDLVVKIPRAGSIEGALAGFVDVPRVIARRHADGALFHGEVAGTEFRIRGLSPGSYSVAAVTDSEAAIAESVNVMSAEASPAYLRSSGVVVIEVDPVEFGTDSVVANVLCSVGPRMEGAARVVQPDLMTRCRRTAYGLMSEVPAGNIVVQCSREHVSGIATSHVNPGGRLRVKVPMIRTPERRCSIGMRLDSYDDSTRVDDVDPDGAASEAGIAVGDLLLAVDGMPTRGLEPEMVDMAIRRNGPGNSVLLLVSREGRLVQIALRPIVVE